MIRFVRRVLAAVLAVLFAIPLTPPAPARAEAGPDRVTVGVFVNDIQDIDLAADSFTADFYLWFRWKGDVDPTDSIEPMNSNAMQNTTTSETGGVAGKPLYPAPLDMPDGTKYMAFRYQGVFSRKMNLEKYPFDVQNLVIMFEDQNEDTRDLEFVADTTPAAISPLVTMPGYEIGQPTLTVKPHRYPTNFGNIAAPPDAKYSRVTIAIPVTRDPLPYLVKIILPILIVILITSLIYMIPARLEDSRTGIGVTAMLTIVALQWTTDSNLPSVEYLMLLDLIYIVSLVYVLVAMGYTVLASRRHAHEAAEALSTALDRRVGVITLVAYVVVIALTMVLYLNHHHVDPLV
ncbi:MAG TPA: hypothetical protein PLH92_01980 [Mycobacterium sp.]|nr:hypothetical protein [Mycobacterium sp.]HQC75471.1 hypothetical protein [Mycobacterium sp.]